MTLYSMPEGWLGMLLILLFGGLLAIFPTSGFQSAGELSGFDRVADVANHLFLPVLVLTLGYIGEYAIVMRASLLEMMGEDFVQTARAKGVPDRLVRKNHAVPNAILPTFTLVFLSFGFVVGGAIIVESVFSYPGLGLMTYQAINQQDYPVLQAVFLMSSAAVIVFNLLADILYGYLDPRIRSG
jgi:peptide/nickel transport system permease protein